MKEGIDVWGYYLWSLMDNWEWAAGQTCRYGVVHMDFSTQQRTWKDSAHWYGQAIREKGFEE